VFLTTFVPRTPPPPPLATGGIPLSLKRALPSPRFPVEVVYLLSLESPPLLKLGKTFCKVSAGFFFFLVVFSPPLKGSFVKVRIAPRRCLSPERGITPLFPPFFFLVTMRSLQRWLFCVLHFPVGPCGLFPDETFRPLFFIVRAGLSSTPFPKTSPLFLHRFPPPSLRRATMNQPLALRFSMFLGFATFY